MLKKYFKFLYRILKLNFIHIWIYFSSEMVDFSSVWCQFASNNNE
jgi:hypothetical protein